MKLNDDMQKIVDEIREQRPELKDDEALIDYCLINTVDIIRTRGLTKFDYDEIMNRLEQIETRVLEVNISQKKMLDNMDLK